MVDLTALAEAVPPATKKEAAKKQAPKKASAKEAAAQTARKDTAVAAKRSRKKAK